VKITFGRWAVVHGPFEAVERVVHHAVGGQVGFDARLVPVVSGFAGFVVVDRIGGDHIAEREIRAGAGDTDEEHHPRGEHRDRPLQRDPGGRVAHSGWRQCHRPGTAVTMERAPFVERAAFLPLAQGASQVLADGGVLHLQGGADHRDPAETVVATGHPLRFPSVSRVGRAFWRIVIVAG
jgi:hypothetical protein